MISTFDQKHVVLTGDFAMGDREHIATEIVAAGGIIHSGVTKKVDYVIVGALGSRSWKTPLGGTKIIKAEQLGIPLVWERDIAQLLPESFLAK